MLAAALPGLGLPAAAAAAHPLFVLSGSILLGGYALLGARRLKRRLRPPILRGGSAGLRIAAGRTVGELAAGASAVSLAAGITRRGSPAATDTIAAGGSPFLDAGTVLEVGSITKTITGLLLAELARAGVVGLDDDAGAILGLAQLREITLLELATHRGGLPRVPRAVLLRAVLQHPDPYRGFGEDRLLRCVPAPAAARPTYSNLGFAVLGLALARAAGCGYAQLAAELVLRPLGMTRSGFAIAVQTRGHDRFGVPVPPWHLGAFGPAAGLRSTVQDLLILSDAVLRAPEGPLGQSVALATSARAPFRDGRSAGLGWMIHGSLVFHNGASNGMYAWVGADRQRNCGAAVIATSPARPRFDAAAEDFLRAAGNVTAGRR